MIQEHNLVGNLHTRRQVRLTAAKHDYYAVVGFTAKGRKSGRGGAACFVRTDSPNMHCDNITHHVHAQGSVAGATVDVGDRRQKYLSVYAPVWAEERRVWIGVAGKHITKGCIVGGVWNSTCLSPLRYDTCRQEHDSKTLSPR